MISKYRQEQIDNLLAEIITLTQKGILTWEDKELPIKGNGWVTENNETIRLFILRDEKKFVLEKNDRYYGWIAITSGCISDKDADALYSLLLSKEDKVQLDILSHFVNTVYNRKEQE